MGNVRRRGIRAKALCESEWRQEVVGWQSYFKAQYTHVKIRPKSDEEGSNDMRNVVVVRQRHLHRILLGNAKTVVMVVVKNCVIG